MCEDGGYLSASFSPYDTTAPSNPPPFSLEPSFSVWTVYNVIRDGGPNVPQRCVKKKGAFSTALNGVGSPLYSNQSDQCLFPYDSDRPLPVYASKRYKPVANRVKPVKTTLPEEYRII
jgi:hypothetical protein